MVNKIETQTTTYWIENGIIFSKSKDSKRTIENLTESHNLLQTLTHGKPMPTLVYVCKSPMPDKATRDFSAMQLPKLYTAMAMVSDSALGIFILNLVFKFKKSSIPTKSFVNESEAIIWLKNQ